MLPDPLAAQQQQDQLKDQAARQAQSRGTGAPQSPQGTGAPQAPAPPVSPQNKANQKRRAGRGIEGSDDEGPTNPMDPGNKYDWDSFSTTPRL